VSGIPFLEQADCFGRSEVEQGIDQAATGKEAEVTVVFHFEDGPGRDLCPHVLGREGGREGRREGEREGGVSEK
jgi:hypothetical protein